MCARMRVMIVCSCGGADASGAQAPGTRHKVEIMDDDDD